MIKWDSERHTRDVRTWCGKFGALPVELWCVGGTHWFFGFPGPTVEIALVGVSSFDEALRAALQHIVSRAPVEVERHFDGASAWESALAFAQDELNQGEVDDEEED